jgi:hypothetical protein
MTCKLSVMGKALKVLLTFPFSLTANSTPTVALSPANGRSKGIWSVTAVMRQSGDGKDSGGGGGGAPSLLQTDIC